MSVNEQNMRDRLAGTLLGTALGDALGLPVEGLSAKTIARRFGKVDRFRLLGKTGYVSDDTEQAALIAQSLAKAADDPQRCAREFRRALFGWFCRLPFGAGRATIRACVKIGLGISPSGVKSAGNGSAMRAATIGVFFHDDPIQRAAFGRALSEVTHRDVRAVEGALFVAEVASACVQGSKSPADCIAEGRVVVQNAQLGEAIDQALELARAAVDTLEAARILGNSGFVVHSAALSAFFFARYRDDPLSSLSEAVSAGGDTDSIAAILGSWIGALVGESGLPTVLIARIHDGPFGPTHLRALAGCLSEIRLGKQGRIPSYSALTAFGRNLALLPVILGHGFRRLVPW